MVDTAIVDHLPLAYEDALHALYGNGLPEPGDDERVLNIENLERRGKRPSDKA